MGYSITRIARGSASLESIAVAPAARGKGAADSLLASTIRRLRRRGIARLFLMVKSTNERARTFYERHGFRKIRLVPQYYEDGESGLLLRRAID